MKISTKGRYALRLMIDLAQNKEQGNISLKDVAKRQEISIKYLEQIATPLIRASLIKSVRGAQGGYSLTREMDKYTAKDILVAVEGPISCVACLETEPNQCPRYSECLTLPFYKGLNKPFFASFSSTLCDSLKESSKSFLISFITFVSFI